MRDVEDSGLGSAPQLDLASSFRSTCTRLICAPDACTLPNISHRASGVHKEPLDKVQCTSLYLVRQGLKSHVVFSDEKSLSSRVLIYSW